MPQELIEGFRLSPQQQSLWFAQQDGRVFKAQCAVELSGRLDAKALRDATARVVARHDALRTVFQCLQGMNVPLQVISEQAELNWRELDFSDLSQQERPAVIERIFVEESAAALDIEHGPIGRFTLLKFSAEEHLLLVTLPALCADGRTLKNLIEECARNYAAPPLDDDAAGTVDDNAAEPADDDADGEPLQYVQFSEWQHELLEAEEDEGGREFWLAQNAAAAQSPSLPFDAKLPAVTHPGLTATQPESVVFIIDAELVESMEATAKRHEVSLSVVLLACWQGLLWRLAGEQDISVRVFFDGRKFEELREAMGLFGRHLPIVTRFDEELNFDELAAKVGRGVEEVSSWQEHFVEENGREAIGGSSLPVAFEFDEWPAYVSAGDVRVSLLKQTIRAEEFKLKLSCLRTGDSLKAELHYEPSVYPAATVEHLKDRFNAFLESVLKNPQARLGDLDVLGATEKRLLLEEWNETRTDYRHDALIHKLFEEQARRTPDATAVVFEDRRLSFGELDRRANQVAHYLRRLGTGPEKCVGLMLERSVEMLVGLLGILKAGGAYLPLDPGQPKQRLDFMLEDARPAVLLSQQSLSENFHAGDAKVVLIDSDRHVLAQESEAPPNVELTSENLAYVIYTSGSTGKPKGTMVAHRSAINLLTALRRSVYSQSSAPLRISLNAPLAFDASVKQLIQLLDGHALYIVPEEMRRDGAALLSFVERRNLNVLDCTPSHLKLMRAAGFVEGPSPDMILVGGEAWDEADWALYAEHPETKFYNVYGPTECTVNATVCALRDAPARPTIGRPIANVRTYILDSKLRPVPVGARGELYIGGAGVARGYLNRAALTAERFLPEPFGGERGGRMYRTGDLARHLPDGNIEFLGRADYQVKVRGYRIELGEIESVIEQHPAIREAVVTAREDEPGDKRLVAYVVPEGDSAHERNAAAQYKLPNGMTVAHQNKNETDYLYEEIFEKQTYIRHGIELPDDACVFDVGANIGMFTLFVGERCSDARIYAFEPLAPIFEKLEVNAPLSGANVKLFNIGLSDAEKTETFTFYPRYSMMSGTSAYANPEDEVEVIKSFLSNEQQAGDADVANLLEHADELLEGRFEAETHECRLRTLSSVIRESGVEQIDLLKIDVQRAEMDVLRGIDAEDWKKIRQVVMEVHDGQGMESEGRIGEIGELLGRQGFTVVAEQDELLKGTDRYNLYAVQRERQAAPRPEKAPEAAERYLVKFDRPAFAVEDLRKYLEQSLPDYMVPQAFVVLDELPLNRNGKIDRAALPAPDVSGHDAERDYVPPQTEMEKMLAEVWCEVLGLERVGIHDSFFHLGGDSIRSIKLQVVAQKRGLNFSLQDIFRHQTIHELARHVGATEPGEEVRRLSRPFSLISDDDRRLIPDGVEDAYPLSLLQLGMLFHSEYNPESAMYYNANTLHLKAPFDAGAMRAAILHLMNRHAVLRTSFDLTHFSKALQLVHTEAGVPLVVEDLRELSQAEQQQFVNNLVESERRIRFDWTRPPLIRFKVHRRSDETFQFTWCEHHSILDGWSLAGLTTELFQNYFALLEDENHAQAPAPIVTYRDFVALEQQSLESEEDRNYWLSKLNDGATASLPNWESDENGGAGQTRLHIVSIPLEVSAGLKRLAQSAGVTIKSVLLAAHLKVMSVLGGGPDVVTGLVSNGRPEEIDGDEVLGLFLNTLPLRLKLSGGTWLELVRDTFEAERELLPYRRYPMAQLQKELGGAPLFETMFNFTHFHVLHNMQELRKAQLLEWESAVVDINLTLTTNFELDPVSTDVGLNFQYDASRIGVERIKSIGDYYVNALKKMADEPHARHDSASLLSEPERLLLQQFNETSRLYDLDICLHQLFERQVSSSPDAPALVFDGQTLTYRELNERANRLAHFLIERGIGPESLVGLFLPRSMELVTALLGVLKAGAAYLPLDLAYPQQRLGFMLEDARVSMLLSLEHLRDDVPQSSAKIHFLDADTEELQKRPASNPAATMSAGNLAYVIYTSGSTGTPKAAMNAHRGICNRLLWMQEAMSLNAGDTVLQKTPYSFDVSVWEFFWPLLVGAKLLVAEPGGHQDPSYLKKLIAEQEVTTLHFVPSMLEVFLEQEGLREACRSVRRVVCSGEALSRALEGRFYERMPEHVQLYNLYGPTEAAVDVSWWTCDRKSRRSDVPIGRPIANTQLYVLDEELRLAAPGVRGELYIAGTAVGRGYLRRPELTAERFVPDPFGPEGGARMYRTGDEVWLDAEGALRYVGRKDGQVKLRGQRIELGEVEAAMSEHEQVKQCAVVLEGREGGGGEPRLVCYVVKRGEVRSADLREHARKSLPEYMVPGVYVTLDEMPLTASGKVDRRALPGADAEKPESDVEYVAPQTDIEEVMAGIWSQVLGVERVGIHDNFFDAGGDSLLATQLIARVNSIFQLDIPLRATFDKPTVHAISSMVERLLIEQVLQQPAGDSR